MRKPGNNQSFVISLHIIAWLLIFIIPVILVYSYGDGDSKPLMFFYSNTALFGVLFYINYLYLVPHYYLGGKKIKYFILAAIAIVVMYLVHEYIQDWLWKNFIQGINEPELVKKMEPDEKHKPPVKEFKMYVSFLASVLVCGFSLGLRVIQKLNQNEQERKELEKEKLNSELAFLKNQVSPHFFFNTLNNIYSLIGSDTTQAQESVLKLSKLMRYLLYESEHGKTRLDHEIDFMKHYIDLMKLRVNQRVNIDITFPSQTYQIEIPPLLLIPFIENAFKHGISNRELSYIRVLLMVTENSLEFRCENSVHQHQSEARTEHGGIGLENVKKRLNLLYPRSHSLTIDSEKEHYRVNLNIKL